MLRVKYYRTRTEQIDMTGLNAENNLGCITFNQKHLSQRQPAAHKSFHMWLRRWASRKLIVRCHASFVAASS